MRLEEALQHAFDQIRGLVEGTAQGMHPDALTWRPDPQGNTIAWLLWHQSRVQDDHDAELAGADQVWSAQGWAERFGLPAGAMDTGYGHSPEQVAAITPADPQVIVDYHDQVTQATRAYLSQADRDFDGVIDDSYDPPVTVGVRLLSVTIDALQHAGQAAYLRGMWERRSMAGAAAVTVDVDDLPGELRSRVLAATAHAGHRRIDLVPDQDPAAYAVEAVSGDRLTLMHLSLQPDGSVAETTQSITADEVVELHHGEEQIELLVGEPDVRRRLLVSPAAAAALLPSPG